jgi:hypothetical protein
MGKEGDAGCGVARCALMYPSRGQAVADAKTLIADLRAQGTSADADERVKSMNSVPEPAHPQGASWQGWTSMWVDSTGRLPALCCRTWCSSAMR